MEEEKKIIAVQDTTGGLKSQTERDLYNWINDHPEEVAQWMKSLSQPKPEKKKLVPRIKDKLKDRPKATMFYFPSVQVKTDRT